MNNEYKAVVMGVSAGGMDALTGLFSCLPQGFPLPIIVVQHLSSTQDGYLFEHFNRRCALTVKEADEKERIQPGHIYFAPPGYHLLVERDETFSLSVDEKVNYARPSIDVLFVSAAHAWPGGLIGIILTGANHDGAHGMCVIQAHGGLTIAQDPATALHPVMPKAAVDAGCVDRILGLEAIGAFLRDLIFLSTGATP